MSSVMPAGAELAKLARAAKREENTTRYQRKKLLQFYSPPRLVRDVRIKMRDGME